MNCTRELQNILLPVEALAHVTNRGEKLLGACGRHVLASDQPCSRHGGTPAMATFAVDKDSMAHTTMVRNEGDYAL